MNSTRGFNIERRAFIALPAFAALGTLSEVHRELELQGSPQKMTFEAFVQETGALAKKLIAEADRNESEYLHNIAAMADRLGPIPDTPLGQPYKGIIRTGMNYRGSGIVVVQWSMEKGLTYPPHNHPNYNGITVGIDGECRIRNFDIVGVMPEMGKDSPFQVRETQTQLMTPGRVVSMMSTRHNNIHTLHTHAHGTRGIDVMTLVGKHVGFSFVQIQDGTKNDEGLYPAKWGEYLAR